MPNRIAIATEGPSDEEVLEEICSKAGHQAWAASAEGKDALFRDFDKILRGLEAKVAPSHFLVVTDLQPEQDCPSEADRWRQAIRRRFPRAKLCLCIWELEAWLLADPSAVHTVLGVDHVHHHNPDKIGDTKPSKILEDMFHKKLGCSRGTAYDKKSDGKALAQNLDLRAASQASPSLEHFLQTIKMKQERLL